MKVSVCYTIVKDIVIEVDDKFKSLSESYCPSLTGDLLEAIYTSDEIPDNCDIISVFDDDTDDVLYES